MKSRLLYLWNILFDVKEYIKLKFLLIKDYFYCKSHSAPKVMSVEQTIDYIVENNCSVSRYGDGEIKLCCGKDISFQRSSDRLSQMLAEPLRVNEKGFLPCIVDCFAENSDKKKSTSEHWKKHMSMYRKYWYMLTDSNIFYGNAFISRPYMQYADKSNCAKIFNSIKRIWNGRDIAIVEGMQSRLGVGNDLFDNVNSIKRILVPVRDAFECYDRILSACVAYEKSTLFLLALGPSATVLAYDLHKCGFQAVDIGHIDVEYEWFLNGETEKKPVKYKFVNEANNQNAVEDCNDESYISQIVAEIS